MENILERCEFSHEFHSHSELAKPVYEISSELRKARCKLQDAIWEEDEEAQAALRREIERLEIKISLGETYEYRF